MAPQSYSPAHDGQPDKRQQIREATELLLLRGNLLSRDDRALLQMIFDRGGTFAQISRLTGLSATTISRRFHRILKKLMAREMVALLGETKNADPLEISIARAYFVQGLSQADISEKLGVSGYRVRLTLRHIREIAYHNAIRKASQ